MGLRPADPAVAVASVETVVAAGAAVVLTGTGFNNPLVNLFASSGNVGPITTRRRHGDRNDDHHTERRTNRAGLVPGRQQPLYR